MGNIVSISQLKELRGRFREENKIVVFTNGTFDILHRGHVEYLNKAKEIGDVLIVGLNSDSSVRAIKGEGKPVIPEDDRAYILSNLACVDYVVIFEEDTPLILIETLIPDVLIKGADWAPDQIVGRDIVERHGGKVMTIELIPGRSSSSIIENIINKYHLSREG